MTWLAENSLPIWVGGAVALAMAAVVYFHTRTNGALLGVGAVLIATALLLLTEQLIETPREAIERSLYQLAAAVEANDVTTTLTFLAPSVSPEIRKDVEILMPTVRIERARVLQPVEIELNNEDAPMSATVKCQGLIIAVDKRNRMKGGAQERVTMIWVRSGDRWLFEEFVSHPDWRRAR